MRVEIWAVKFIAELEIPVRNESEAFVAAALEISDQGDPALNRSKFEICEILGIGLAWL